MEDAIVLYPSPAIGHLYIHGRAGKVYTDPLPIFLYQDSYHSPSIQCWLHWSLHEQCLCNNQFHHVPPTPPNLSPLNISSPHHETLAFELLCLNNPNVLHAIESISNTCMVHVLIMDLFCCSDFSVAVDLNIPAYFFFPSGAACLASILYMPFLHRNTNKSFKDLKTNLDIPGMPPIPSTDMPKPTLERNEEVYEDFLNASIQLPKSAGIIVNTFESLEPRANKAILEGHCVPDEPTPPVYCIGPLIAADDRSGSDDGGAKGCLSWLNS